MAVQNNTKIPEKAKSQLAEMDAETTAGINISLVSDGQTIQPDGSILVNIAVPEGFDGTKCKVLRCEDDGTLTDMNAVYEDGRLIFATDRFSLYIVAQIADLIYGDANDDGIADLNDAILAAQIDVNNGKTQNGNIKKIDVNGDGKVTVHDALLIVRFVLGIVDKFPVTK